MRLELRDLDAVDGRPRLAHLPDFLFGHFADPQHPMPLQAGVGEIDGAFVERLVEIAAPDQDEVHEIAGEFQQQPLARVVLPGPQPAVREPDAVAVAEAELHRRAPDRGCRADSRTLCTTPPFPRPPPLLSANRQLSPAGRRFAAIDPDVSAHRSWSIPRSAALSRAVAGCMRVEARARGQTPGASSDRFATLGFSCVDSESSVADSGSSGRLIAFSSSFLSSVKICACSLPRVTAT